MCLSICGCERVYVCVSMCLSICACECLCLYAFMHACGVFAMYLLSLRRQSSFISVHHVSLVEDSCAGLWHVDGASRPRLSCVRSTHCPSFGEGKEVWVVGDDRLTWHPIHHEMKAAERQGGLFKGVM